MTTNHICVYMGVCVHIYMHACICTLCVCVLTYSILHICLILIKPHEIGAIFYHPQLEVEEQRS